MLTHERLTFLLNYDPETGAFTWKNVTTNRVKVGSVAGCPDLDGYILIGIDGKLYKAHRLALFYVTGVMPTLDVDHRDGNTANNRFGNLREVPRSINAQNQRKVQPKNKTSKYLGVSFDRGLFIAQIMVDGVRHRLGRFATEEAAHEAYVAAKRRLHAGCTI